MTTKESKGPECESCGETENLEYCAGCRVYFCSGEQGCFEYRSSHLDTCSVMQQRDSDLGEFLDKEIKAGRLLV